MLKKVAAGLAMLLLLNGSTEACTTMLATKGATEDGSVLVAHSNDGFGVSANTAFVPARNHPKGSLRPVYPCAAAVGEMPEYNCFIQPNLVAPERGDGYNYPGRPQTKPIGHIPEVEHTYAYIDSFYPIVNEHGLMMGECTDLSVRQPETPFEKGKSGLFYADELGRVAMERCKTAREAIALMGSLIDEYGLWGTAETLIVADKNEGWVLEMQPAPDQKGGLWIAERIPDGHFFVAANQLRIRSINEGDPNQMFNPGLPQRLKELGWAAYDEQGKLDWVKSLQGGEYNHPYYSLRRVWRVMSTVAPSLGLSPETENWDSKAYPLSVRPDKKLKLGDIISIYRDYYEGTEFDKSKSPLAGLYGSPYHYGKEKGERAIMTAKSSFTYVTQLNDNLPSPVMWLSTNDAGANPFVPFAVAKLPAAYSNSLRDSYDPSKMYWASSQVMALTQGYYNIMQPLVSEALRKSESNSLELVNSSRGLTGEKFSEALNHNAVKVFDDWKDLYIRLLTKYNAGAGVQYERLPDPGTPEKYHGKPGAGHEKLATDKVKAES
ncbi:MAG: C69 family dipeptidase [Acidaminococcaceae bacterium]|nr:C69 family dipeptidase [Acidaminococcaceae bacterium]